jgi:hypothetical protein
MRRLSADNGELFRAVIHSPDGTDSLARGPYTTHAAAQRELTVYLNSWARREAGWTGAVETTETKWAPVGAEPLPAPQTPLHSFTEWPKTPRLFRDITVTEKIDGTNGALAIRPLAGAVDAPDNAACVEVGGQWFAVFAQSRKRIVTPAADNYGFAGWVWNNASQLAGILGAGVHYGEWWGSGIQRRYGYANGERCFSLFNTDKFGDDFQGGGHQLIGGVAVSAVPILYRGPMDTTKVTHALSRLRAFGSVAAPGFANPEGICVYHHASRKVFKATLDANDAGKWEVATP